MLVGFDTRGQIRDFYFPYVGLENHIGVDHLHRIGVFADGRLVWLSDPSFVMRIDYDKETAAGKISARSESLGVALFLTDVVYNEKNILVREIVVENLRAEARTIKVFFIHQFDISESHRGDTGYYDPRARTIVHYKGRRVFLANALCGKVPFDDWSVGLFEVEGKEGTHLDALDGMLSKNPIEHGAVDSAIAVSVACEPSGRGTIHYWLVVGESLREAIELNTYVLEKTPAHLMRTTRDFWHAWVNRQNFSFYGLDESLVDAFKKSLLIIRAHVDNNGAIIASSDSDMLHHGRDSYSYVWPRDAAYAAMALDRAGDFTVARKFFEFCNDVIAEHGYFMHKYRPDKSLGSSWHPWLRGGKSELPIQEDETAIVLVALWRHYRLTKDLEFIESVYSTLIKGCADFLKSYVQIENGLPYPSYDLWEQKHGIATYTLGVKYGALTAAANFAHLLGKNEEAQGYNEAAAAIRDTIMTHLWNPSKKMFLKLININEKGEIVRDQALDMSSFYGVFRFGVLEVRDEKLQTALNTLESNLLLTSGARGMPRYTEDEYYRVPGREQSNPWFVTTLWLAQYYIASAKKETDLTKARLWLSWAVGHSLSSGMMSEQLDPQTGEQISASPLVWSHAEFVHTVIDYLEKLEEMGICVACNPVSEK